MASAGELNPTAADLQMRLCQTLRAADSPESVWLDDAGVANVVDATSPDAKAR